jgi:GH43 family beta-xylosidase
MKSHFNMRIHAIFSLILCIVFSCNDKKSATQQSDSVQSDSVLCNTYINPLLPTGAEPWAMYHNGKYYYTHGCENKIVIWQTGDITDLRHAESKEVWTPKEAGNSSHLWGPEIHFLNNKWYVYFAADDGNMDNHQIYVIENAAENPFDGEFVMKGRIQTDKNNNWAIHANVFEHNEKLYMVWSGWQTRRIEAETSCIYIAEMENPWTLKSDRILISQPEYEWERQWINPDGSKTAYPIYVNEAPQFFQTKNKDKILLLYSASGNWTPYYAVGMLAADAGSNLLDTASWSKSEEPVFCQSAENKVFATGNFSFIPSPDGKDVYFIYHARSIENEASGALDSRSPRMQKVEWDPNGFPLFGTPWTETEVKK